MTRAAATVPELSRLFVGLLGHLSEGSVEVVLGAEPLASLDARTRNIELQVRPLLAAGGPHGTASRIEGAAELWKARRVPSELARIGWRITVSDGSEELLAVGRGTSALTGHVHAPPATLWKLRKFL